MKQSMKQIWANAVANVKPSADTAGYRCVRLAEESYSVAERALNRNIRKKREKLR